MKIATTTDDFKDYVATDDVAGATKLLAQCGFRHVDVNMLHADYRGSALCSDNWREWAEGILKAGIEAKVDFVQAHGSEGCFDRGAEREYRIGLLKRELHICNVHAKPGILKKVILRGGYAV